MGDETVGIRSPKLVLGAGVSYISRPGLPEGGDRIGYEALVAAQFETYTAPYHSFRWIIGGTAGREQALQAPETNLTAVGLDAGAYFEAILPGGYLGVDLNPRVVIPDNGGSPAFELGVIGRFIATLWPVLPMGFALSVGGDLRPADMGLSAVEVQFGIFANL